MNLQDLIELVQSKVDGHRYLQQKYLKDKDIYNGKFKILKKQKKEIEKANNKLVHNFIKVVVRNSNAYFLGDKITITNNKNERINEILQDVIKESNLLNYVYNLAIESSIYGLDYLLTYINADNELKFIPLNPSNVILHKNVFGQSEYAITLAEQYNFIQDTTDILITYYDKKIIGEFIIRESVGRIEVLDIRVNKLKRIPIVEFRNNIDAKNEIDDVLHLIDAYNLTQSNRLDDNEELRHAILHINNASTDENFLKGLSQYNIMNTKDGNAEKKVEIKYLAKPTDNNTDAILDRLHQDIFTIAGVPDFQSMDFTGGDTIIAIRSKLYPLISKTKEKEELFISSFKYIFKLLEKYISIKYSINFSYKDIEINFVRPTFTNVSEELDNAKKLKELEMVSDATILNNVSLIKDVKEELEKYKNQDNTDKKEENIEDNTENIDYFKE